MKNASLPLPARALALFAAATAAALALASTASAARDPIATGSTDMHMKRGFERKLANTGVIVQGLGAGTVSGKKIGLPVRDGMFDPTVADGFLEAGGGFKFSRGNRGAPVTKVVINTVNDSVYAQVAGARMQFGTLTLPANGREGFGAFAKFSKLTLTEKAARRISNRLGLTGTRRINGGRVLSNSYSTAQPGTLTLLAQGSARLDANAATLAKLAAKGVKVPEGLSAIEPASKPAPTSFEFPVAGGTLSADGASGSVQTGGGLQIAKQAPELSPTVKLSGFQLDLTAKVARVEMEISPTPPFAGKVGNTTLLSLAVPANAVEANPATRTITVKGVEGRLQASAASTLNDVFNQPPPAPPSASNFVLGDPFGSFSMTLQAQ